MTKRSKPTLLLRASEDNETWLLARVVADNTPITLRIRMETPVDMDSITETLREAFKLDDIESIALVTPTTTDTQK